MLYLSDLEESLGSLDSVNMESIFDIDKFDLKTEMSDLSHLLSPYISSLSSFDYSLYRLYFILGAEVDTLALYLDISSAAIYKRIRALRSKLKMMIYLNMSKEQLFKLLDQFVFDNPSHSEYLSQFLFHRTSRVGKEGQDFELIKSLHMQVKNLSNSPPNLIENYTKRRIHSNSKRHLLKYKIKKIDQVITHIIESKAYRYNIFRGELSGKVEL